MLQITIIAKLLLQPVAPPPPSPLLIVSKGEVCNVKAKYGVRVFGVLVCVCLMQPREKDHLGLVYGQQEREG